MNDTIKTIMDRRSIRSYTDKPVARKDLQTIVAAGQHAPSAVNRQPWHFTVVQNQELLDELNRECVEYLLDVGDDEHLLDMVKHPKFHTTYHAPAVIVISMEEGLAHGRFDCGIAVENMVLAATSLGLGTCIIGMADPMLHSERGEKYKDTFALPKGYAINLLLAVGHIKTPPSSTLERRKNTVTYID